MTNIQFFNQTELPKRFGVIGSGVIGLELAQCMQRFGSQVTSLALRWSMPLHRTAAAPLLVPAGSAVANVADIVPPVSSAGDGVWAVGSHSGEGG